MKLSMPLKVSAVCPKNSAKSRPTGMTSQASAGAVRGRTGATARRELQAHIGEKLYLRRETFRRRRLLKQSGEGAALL